MSRRRESMDPQERERLREVNDTSRTEVRDKVRDSLRRRQAIAKTLAELDAKHIAKLELDPALLEDVRLFARLGKGSALARQRRKVTRTLGNYDFEEIERRLEIMDGNVRTDAQHHHLERLLAELLEGADEALATYLVEHPEIDRQQLRQAIRAAQAEQAKGTGKRKRTLLFRMLRDS